MSGNPVFFCWVKRLGQWHLSPLSDMDQFSAESTLCDKPMLGNNYSRAIPDNEREKCPRCFAIAEALTKERL